MEQQSQRLAILIGQCVLAWEQALRAEASAG